MNPQSTTVIERSTTIKVPSLYAVIIHNDDVTSMEFVVEVLVDIFHKAPPDAAALMMDVHEQGQGIAGVYVFDLAATKKSQADQLAAERGFPLKLTIREVQG